MSNMFSMKICFSRYFCRTSFEDRPFRERLILEPDICSVNHV